MKFYKLWYNFLNSNRDKTNVLYFIFFNDVIADVRDSFPPFLKAKDEYSKLKHEIVESIKTELLIDSTKLLDKRGDRIQESLDRCSESIWDLFTYEESKLKNADLNDWINCDDTLKAFLECDISNEG